MKQARPFTVVFDMDNTLTDTLGQSVRPGIPDLLDRLTARSDRLVLWTQSPRRRARVILSEFHLTPYFSEFLYREDYDPRNQNVSKDIRRCHGQVLIDDDPGHIAFVNSIGRVGLQIEAYRDRDHDLPVDELLAIEKKIARRRRRYAAMSFLRLN